MASSPWLRVRPTLSLAEGEGNGRAVRLGGHTLSGSANPITGAPTSPGIVNPGFDDLTVRNGILSGFTTAGH